MNTSRQCKGKKPYDSKADALYAANRVNRVNGEDVHAYECPECGAWHIGHPQGSGYADERSPGRAMRGNRRYRR